MKNQEPHPLDYLEGILLVAMLSIPLFIWILR